MAVVKLDKPKPMSVRAGDIVEVIAGKDRGKRGKVLEARPRERRVIVENVNVMKRHQRPRALRDSSRMGRPQIQPGGILDIAAPLPVSNVMIVGPSCDRPTRVGVERREGKDGLRKVRVCKRPGCGHEVER
jgi:large subunit ribosomal protein L24